MNVNGGSLLSAKRLINGESNNYANAKYCFYLLLYVRSPCRFNGIQRTEIRIDNHPCEGKYIIKCN